MSSKGQEKLRKLKTAESLFAEENNPDPETFEFNRQFSQYSLPAQLTLWPHFRPLIPIVEWLQKLNKWATADDYRVMFHMPFLAQVHGWNLGTGWNIRAGAPYYPELQAQCNFAKGECYMVAFPPLSLVDHTAEWYIIDVADPSTYNGDGILHGFAPYSELAKFQPIEMDISHLEQWSITCDKNKTQ